MPSLPTTVTHQNEHSPLELTPYCEDGETPPALLEEPPCEDELFFPTNAEDGAANVAEDVTFEFDVNGMEDERPELAAEEITVEASAADSDSTSAPTDNSAGNLCADDAKGTAGCDCDGGDGDGDGDAGHGGDGDGDGDARHGGDGDAGQTLAGDTTLGLLGADAGSPASARPESPSYILADPNEPRWAHPEFRSTFGLEPRILPPALKGSPESKRYKTLGKKWLAVKARGSSRKPHEFLQMVRALVDKSYDARADTFKPELPRLGPDNWDPFNEYCRTLKDASAALRSNDPLVDPVGTKQLANIADRALNFYWEHNNQEDARTEPVFALGSTLRALAKALI